MLDSSFREWVVTQATYRFRSRSEADTDRLAAGLSEYAAPGWVVALDGDLGAGKTRFSQAMARCLGVTDVVNSPTFTIIKEYEGSRYPFYHMDAYRVSLEEAGDLGLDEYFCGDGVTLVEWANRIEPLLPPERLSVAIAVLADGEREFVLRPFGQPYASLCTTLKETGLLS